MKKRRISFGAATVNVRGQNLAVPMKAPGEGTSHSLLYGAETRNHTRNIWKPNAVSPAVPSPLNFAVGRGSLRVVKKLLAAGANPALKKFAWYSPLERAIESRESFDSAVTLALLRKGKFPQSLMARLLSTTVQYGSTQVSSVELTKTLFKRGVGSEAITEADFLLMLRHVAKENRGSSSTGIPSNTRLVVNQLSNFGCEVPPFVIVALL